MYNVLKVPTFRLNLQPSSGESEKIIRKRHVTYSVPNSNLLSSSSTELKNKATITYSQRLETGPECGVSVSEIMNRRDTQEDSLADTRKEICSRFPMVSFNHL